MPEDPAAQSTENGTENGVNYSRAINKKNVARKKASIYNEYKSLVMRIANQESIEVGDVRQIFHGDVAHFWLKTKNGAIEITQNKYEEIRRIRNEDYERAERELYENINSNGDREGRRNRNNNDVGRTGKNEKTSLDNQAKQLQDDLERDIQGRGGSNYGADDRRSDSQQPGGDRSFGGLGKIKQSRVLSATDGVEETRDLIAVHNTSAEKLADTLKWTGLPAPSIAVIKAAMGHSNYGAISLVFEMNMIDPQANPKAET